jgi:hypothetical protein
MIEYLDALETRTPHSREQALMQRLPFTDCTGKDCRRMGNDTERCVGK